MKSSGKKKSLNIYLGLVRLMDCVMERFLKPLTPRDLHHNDDPYDVHVEKNVKKALEKYWLKHEDTNRKVSGVSVNFQRTIKRMLRISARSFKK